ncbi:hypothetical protein [Streptomyces sp. MN13]
MAQVVADDLEREVIEPPVRTGPGLLVLNAGATPHMAPLYEQTWETFSRH